jgi:hypothetical protein
MPHGGVEGDVVHAGVGGVVQGGVDDRAEFLDGGGGVGGAHPDALVPQGEEVASGVGALGASSPAATKAGCAWS